MFGCDHSRRRSGRPAAARIDTCAGDPCRHRPLEGERTRYLGTVDLRHPGSAGRERYVNRINRIGRSYEVIQQMPLIPETLTRYYVNSAAGQPVPLSNLVTLKTATEPNAFEGLWSRGWVADADGDRGTAEHRLGKSSFAERGRPGQNGRRAWMSNYR